MTDALGQGAAALAGDFDEAGIAGDLVKERQSALGFRSTALLRSFSNCNKASLTPSRSYLMRRCKSSISSC